MDFPRETGQLQIAPLIILPFIENAFKHGVSKFPGTAFVRIKMSIINNTMIFNIVNPKKLVLTSIENYSKGIGLINVQKRLDLMYPGKYILNIDDYDETFLVNLTLELED